MIKKYKNLLPILCLALISIYTIFYILLYKEKSDGNEYTMEFSIENILGFTAILFNIIFYFINKNVFKYLVISTIILGIVGVLNYTFFVTSVDFLFIPIQPISFLAGLTYFILNYSRIKHWFDDVTHANEPIIQDEEKIEKLTNKLQNMSSEELNEIIDSKSYTLEAKIAAKKLLENRE